VIEKEAALECGRQLRRLRRSAGASLPDLAERTAISTRRLSLAESGVQPLTPQEWRRTLRALRAMLSDRVSEALGGLQSIAAS
jgi:transcriptional regulator with XRE-family HTH domain